MSNPMKRFFFWAGPWLGIVLYWGLLLVGDLGTVEAAIGGGVYALGYTLVAMGVNRVTKLDYGGLLFWAVGIGAGLAVPSFRVAYFVDHFSTFFYLSLFIMAFFPVVFGAEPFTVAFAKRKTPDVFWNTDAFTTINRIMTLVWSGIFMVALLITLIPTFWTRVLIPVLFIICIGIPFTKKFPDLYLKAKGLGKEKDVSMVSICAMVFGVLLILVSTAIASDWHALHDLDEATISNQITLLQEKLKKQPENYEAIKGLGIAYHMRAKGDATGYAGKAVDFLTRTLSINAKDYEAMCYLGSATTMLAKTTWNPTKKLSYVKKGTAMMDRAVSEDPDNVSVRMTRAYNSMKLPVYLERGHLALEDFEHLVSLIEKGLVIDVLTRKKIYSSLVDLYAKKGDRSATEKHRRLADEE